jgi:hypothetical protein
MKKLIYSLFVLAMTAMTFTGCEDVPAPYNLPTAGNDTTHVTPPNPSGTGTQDDPFNVAAALNYITTGEGLDKTVYVKGVIVGTPNIDLSYGNATYNISDDKKVSDKLVVYRGFYFNGAKFTADDQIQEGDTVVVSGKLTNYNGTNEFTIGNSVYSINGKTSGSSGNPTEPSGDGTETSPYNIAKAQSIIAAGTYKPDKVYISGTISKISSVDTNYGNATYYVSDDGTATGQLEVYRGYYLAGAKFTSESQIKVGDKVVILGVLTSYNKTPEVKIPEVTGSQLVTLNGSTTGGSTEEGESITEAATDMGFTDKGVAETATLSDGTTLAFAKAEGTSDPKYYAGSYAAVRMYAKNTLIITATNKTIVKVSITTTDGYKGTLYNGNDEAYAMSGDTKVAINKASDTQAIFSGLSASTITIVNDYTAASGGVQLRIKSITITYAK